MVHAFEYEYILNKREPEEHILYDANNEDHQAAFAEWGYSKTETSVTAVEETNPETGETIIRNITVTTHYIFAFDYTTKIIISTTEEEFTEDGKLTEEEIDALVEAKIPNISVQEDHYTETKVLGERSHDIKVDLIKGIDVNQYIIRAELDNTEFRSTTYTYTLEDAAENKQEELRVDYEALIQEVKQYVEDHTHFHQDPVYKYITHIKFSNNEQLEEEGALKEYEAKRIAYDHLISIQNFFYDANDSDVVSNKISTILNS